LSIPLQTPLMDFASRSYGEKNKREKQNTCSTSF
jgi:hypothetical protein